MNAKAEFTITEDDVKRTAAWVTAGLTEAARTMGAWLNAIRELHEPEEYDALAYDCYMEDCEHEDECPTFKAQGCKECSRLSDIRAIDDTWPIAYPCPTINAITETENPVDTTPALAADQVIVTAPTARAKVLLALNEERDRQDAKWGEQNHPDGTGTGMRPLAGIGLKPTANASAWAAGAKVSTDELAAAGIVTYSDILLEEIFEALAEHDPEKLRNELVQSAAVIVQWVEAIDRRSAL